MRPIVVTSCLYAVHVCDTNTIVQSIKNTVKTIKPSQTKKNRSIDYISKPPPLNGDAAFNQCCQHDVIDRIRAQRSTKRTLQKHIAGCSSKHPQLAALPEFRSVRTRCWCARRAQGGAEKAWVEPGSAWAGVVPRLRGCRPWVCCVVGAGEWQPVMVASTCQCHRRPRPVQARNSNCVRPTLPKVNIAQ